MVNLALVRTVRQQLARRADPVKAAGMRRYMKSVMPYRGVQTPAQRALWREVFSGHPLETSEDWRDTVLALWRGAGYREERYAALALTGERRYRAFQTLDTVPLYEELIVTGAWWDYVDLVASRRLGPLLASYPREMAALLKRWARDANLWKRRSAILAQLGFKERTDLRLLYGCIEPNLDDREFFIRKAIGWALRQYAWTDATEVRRYVVAHAERLSSLSRREALKNVGGSRRAAR